MDKPFHQWTDRQTIEMIDLIQAGWTMRETADILNERYDLTLTKNAVVGKYNRTKPH